MKKDIVKGDILKSNPLEGYWVCSLVLSFQPKGEEFTALSHVAITNAVFNYDFEMSDIDTNKLNIIYTKNSDGNLVPCIEIHTTKLPKEIQTVGHLNTNSYYPHSLEFQIGSGSDGGWPLCGPLSKSLGYQSVHQWRSANDRVAWLNDISEAAKSHEEMLERLKNV